MKHIYTYITLWLLTALLSVPATTQAQCTGPGGNPVICNPLNSSDVTGLISDIISAVLILSVPVIVLFIIYAGFLFVTAGGDERQIETAKKTALYTVIGAAIILGAELISTILAQTAVNLGADISTD